MMAQYMSEHSRWFSDLGISAVGCSFLSSIRNYELCFSIRFPQLR